MHPILARRGRMGPYLAAWVPLAGLLAGATILATGSTWVEALVVTVPLSTIYAFICLAVWYPCQVVPLTRTSLPRVLLTHGVSALVLTFLWLFLAATWVAFLEQFPPFTLVGERFPRLFPVLLAAAVLLYTLAAALLYLLQAFEQASKAEQRELEATVLAREAELKALRAQVDPHFLFNAMNSIASLVTSDPATARHTTLALADFLRDSLRLGGSQVITLVEEVALAEKYLAVERARFGNRLRFERQIGDGCDDCLLPPLLLQPLVENAVKHGIASTLAGGVIRLDVSRGGDNLTIVISNPRDDDVPAPRGEGLGLANVRSRVAAYSGGTGKVATSREPSTFRVEVVLPGRRPVTETLTAGAGDGS